MTAPPAWSPHPPTWEEVRTHSSPIYVGPPTMRSMWLRVLRNAARMPGAIAHALARKMKPRDVLSFAAWLDTARFFGVREVRAPDGDILPFGRVLATLRPLSRAGDSRVGVAMVVLNESDLIERALSSVLSFADDIVVVDGGSTDGTQDIARRLGARVIQRRHDFERFPDSDLSRERNVATRALRTPWVFMLDADEFVPPGLAELVPRLAECEEVDAVFIPFLNLIEEQGPEPSHWPLVLARMHRQHLAYRTKLHADVYGWRRPVVLPISGPYIVHTKSLHRFYRQALRYAAVDPTPYPADWLAWVRDEVDRMESRGGAPEE